MLCAPGGIEQSWHQIKRVSIETASVPAIDMRAITQLAESDELGEQLSPRSSACSLPI